MFQIIQTIEGYEGAIQTHPPTVSRCYSAGLEPFLAGVAKRHVDQPGLSLEDDLAVNRLVFCSAFIGAWYLLNGDKQRSDQTAQTCFMLITGAGWDRELIEGVVMPGYANLERIHCEVLRSKGVGGPLTPKRLVAILIVVVVVVCVLAAS